MAYDNLKDLVRRIASDKVLCDKAFNIAKNAKYGGYQHGLTSVVYKSLDKMFSGANTSGCAVKSEIMPNQQLAEALNKPVIWKFEKRKVYLTFRDNILGCWFSRYAINVLLVVIVNMHGLFIWNTKKL